MKGLKELCIDLINEDTMVVGLDLFIQHFEALSDEFVNHFWQFINDGEYTISQVGDKKQFYRFIKPQAEGFPKMIELFCRKPDLIKEVEGMHLTDIPTGEEVSSLSAILLDDEYYQFALTNTQLINGLTYCK
jgi:hypothetical protein